MRAIFRKRHILELLYLVTQTEQSLSFQGMSRLLLEGGRKVSEPTIKSWFTYLQQDRGFAFYPVTDFEQFGLTTVTALFPSASTIKPTHGTILPKRILATSVFGFNGQKRHLLEQYLVDREEAAELRNELVGHGAVSWETKSEKIFYLPFHKIFTPQGYFIPYSGKLLDVDIQRVVRPVGQSIPCNNSLVKWILIDKLNSYKNSHQVWESLKSKQDAKSLLAEEQVKDTVGIKRIQEALRCSRLKLRHKISYSPFLRDLRQVFYIADLSNKEISQVIKMLGQNSFSVSVFHGKPSLVIAYCNIHALRDLTAFCNSQGRAGDAIYLEQEP